MNPVEVKQPKIFKMTTQRKHSPGQESSQVNKQVEDTAKVKIIKINVQCKKNPTQEKSQPREQANRNSPDSTSLKSSSWAYQAPVVAQRQVPTVQNIQKSVEIHRVQQRHVPMVRFPHVLHKDKFFDQLFVTYRHVHTDSKNVQKAKEAPHVQFFDRVEGNPSFNTGPVVQREQVQ